MAKPSRLRTRPSLGQTIRQHQSALDYLSALTDRPRVDIEAPKPRSARQPRPQPAPTPREADIQRAILDYLRAHPMVSWRARMNTGAATTEAGGFIRFAFRGCPDIIGQLTDGRFLGIEVKRPGGKVSPEQAAFIERVNRHHGVACVAYSVEDVERLLAC